MLDLAPHEALSGVLDAFLATTPPAQLANELFWWHRHDGWHRRIVGAAWQQYR